MSIANLEITMGRITSAEPMSPIAVFITKELAADEKFDAVFADTVVSRMKIKAGKGYIGTFHKYHEPAKVKAILRKRIKEITNNQGAIA